MKINMKKFIQGCSLLIISAVVMVACSSRPETPLEHLKDRRDSLKTVLNKIESQLAEVEKEINRQDSTIQYPLVTTYEVRPMVFRHYFEIYGNVQSDQVATLYAENPGNVEKIAVREGEQVRKGQVLVSLDTEIADKNIAELKTSLELATTLYQKQKRLWDQNIGSEVQYLEAKNRKESLENQLATLREQRGKSTVSAPFDGVVDKIFPKVGEMAGGQNPVVRMVSLKNLYATADVSERYAGHVNAGDSVMIVLASKDTLITEVTRVGSFINPANRTFEIRIDLPDTLSLLRPNSLLRLKVNDLTVRNALVVPTNLVMQDGSGDDFVYVIQRVEGREDYPVAVKRILELGPSQNSFALVKKGLSPGESVIDQGSRSVQTDEPVKITTL